MGDPLASDDGTVQISADLGFSKIIMIDKNRIGPGEMPRATLEHWNIWSLLVLKF